MLLWAEVSSAASEATLPLYLGRSGSTTVDSGELRFECDHGLTRAYDLVPADGGLRVEVDFPGDGDGVSCTISATVTMGGVQFAGAAGMFGTADDPMDVALILNEVSRPLGQFHGVAIRAMVTPGTVPYGAVSTLRAVVVNADRVLWTASDGTLRSPHSRTCFWEAPRRQTVVHITLEATAVHGLTASQTQQVQVEERVGGTVLVKVNYAPYVLNVFGDALNTDNSFRSRVGVGPFDIEGDRVTCTATITACIGTLLDVSADGCSAVFVAASPNPETCTLRFVLVDDRGASSSYELYLPKIETLVLVQPTIVESITMMPEHLQQGSPVSIRLVARHPTLPLSCFFGSVDVTTVDVTQTSLPNGDIECVGQFPAPRGDFTVTGFAFVPNCLAHLSVSKLFSYNVDSPVSPRHALSPLRSTGRHQPVLKLHVGNRRVSAEVNTVPVPDLAPPPPLDDTSSEEESEEWWENWTLVVSISTPLGVCFAAATVSYAVYRCCKERRIRGDAARQCRGADNRRKLQEAPHV